MGEGPPALSGAVGCFTYFAGALDQHGFFFYSRTRINLFVFGFWAKQSTETEFKIAQERTSFWTTARRVCARRAERIYRGKTSGRHFVPPIKSLQKSLSVLLWCIYTTTLEPILAKIVELGERLRAPPQAGLHLKQNFIFL